MNICLRSAHLVGVAGIGGGFLLDVQTAVWDFYWYLTLATGITLSVLYLWSSVAWLFELKGLAIIIKTTLLAVALALPSMRAELFVLVIVISGVMAHAPAWVRGARWARLPWLATKQPVSANGKAGRS